MFRLALTGTIGSGKSTTASMFAEFGCAVWDADEAVHRLYSKGGLAVATMQDQLPDAVRDGAVDRGILKSLIQADPSVLAKIEAIVHPLVREDREQFSAQTDTDIAVFDIPLLFETKSEGEFDAVACVYVDQAEQKRRVLDRGTMTEQQFNMILSKQIPALEKISRSDHVIQTDTLEHARQQVQDILSEIREGLTDA